MLYVKTLKVANMNRGCLQVRDVMLGIQSLPFRDST
jgi:hypothetical protein